MEVKDINNLTDITKQYMEEHGMIPKFQLMDIVFSKQVNKEMLINYICLDIETMKIKYGLFLDFNHPIYICEEDDLEYRSDLNTELEKEKEENSPQGEA